MNNHTALSARVFKFSLYVVVSIGILLRVAQLIHASTLSFDEAWSWWLGSQNILKLLAIAATDKHPPLFYLFIHFWNMNFQNELWIRLPSLIVSIFNIWIFYKLSVYFLKDRLFVLFVLILFILDPMQIQYSAIARSYMIGNFFLLVSTWSFFILMEQKSRRMLLINLITNIILVLFSYLGIFAFLFQAIIVFYMVLNARIQKDFFYSWLKYNAWVLIIIILLIPYAFNQFRVGGFAPKWVAAMVGTPGWGALLSQMTVLGYDLFNLSGPGYQIAIQIAMFLVFFGGFMVVGFRHGFKQFFSVSVLLLAGLAFIPILLFWGLSKVEPVFISRYFMMFHFAYYLLLAFILLQVKLSRLVNFLLIGTIAVGFAAPSYNFISKKDIWETNWKVQSNIIKKNWRNGDVLLVLPISDLVRAKFYLDNFETYKIDKALYKDMFRSKTKPVTYAILDSLFDHWTYPYSRIWFHDEIETGLAAEFFLAPENFVFNYLNARFKADPRLKYTDAHGRLRLYYINPDSSLKEYVH